MDLCALHLQAMHCPPWMQCHVRMQGKGIMLPFCAARLTCQHPRMV